MLHQLKERLEHASNYDALTNLPNRRYMTIRLEEAAAHAARKPEAGFTVMIADVDDFKAVNDNFGHAAGDRVLQAVARARSSRCGNTTCARAGAARFLLLFPACESANAPLVAERLRLAVAAAPASVKKSPRRRSASAIRSTAPSEDIDKTLLRADEALYTAKDSGRNCSVGM